MDCTTRNNVRHGVSGCFGNGKDALFHLVDALASEAGVWSFPEWSFSPLFERTWAILYESLEDSQIDADRLREVIVNGARLPQPGGIVFLGWTRAPCPAQRWRPPQIGRWFRSPICPRTHMLPALGG